MMACTTRSIPSRRSRANLFRQGAHVPKISQTFALVLATVFSGPATRAEPPATKTGGASQAIPTLGREVTAKANLEAQEPELKLEKLRAEIDKLKLEVDESRSISSTIRNWMSALGVPLRRCSSGWSVKASIMPRGTNFSRIRLRPASSISYNSSTGWATRNRESASVPLPSCFSGLRGNA